MSLPAYLEAYRNGRAQLDEVVANIKRTFTDGSADEQNLLLSSVKDAKITEVLSPEQVTTITRIIEAAALQKERNSSSISSSFPTEDEAATPPARLEPGAVLKSRFVLQELLGGGGMGVVYKALDLRKQEADDRSPYIAIKLISENFQRHRDLFITLQREARKAQSLAHPNIITVYDFDRDGPHIFMTMELLVGASLDNIIKEQASSPMRVADAIRIINQIGNALNYAHDNRIVHCDLKPANIIITNTKRVKVIDFGIARAIRDAEDPGSEVTRFDPGTLGALTPAYASPEMIYMQEPDPRDDIYALACIAYELLSGKHPFNRMQSVQAMGRGLHPARIEGLDRRQWRGLQHALAFQREDRTPTVLQFLDEINAKQGQWRPLVAAAGVGVVTAGLVAGGILFGLAQREPVHSDISGETARQSAADDTARLEAQRKEEAAQVEAKRKADEEARLEAQRKIDEAAQAEAKRKADEAARVEAQRKIDEAAQAEAKRKADETARLEAQRKADEAAQAEAKRKAEEAMRLEAQRKATEAAQAEAKRKAEEAARLEAQRKADEAAQAEAKRKAEEAARLEAQRKAQEAAQAEKRKAQEAAQAEAKRKAEEAMRLEAQRKADEAAQAEAKRKAEEAMRLEAQRKATEAAQAEAKRKAEEAARLEAQRKADEAAQAEAKRKAEEAARLEAQRKAQEAAQAEKRKAQEAAQAEAKRKADETARLEAQRKADEAAQAEAKREADETARLEAQRKADEAAQAEAKRKADETARLEAQRKADEAAQAEAKRKADETARLEAQRKAAETTTTPQLLGEDSWSIEDKRAVQQALQTLGRYRGPIDGEFGPATRAALREFRILEGASEDGEFTEPERQKLLTMAQRLAALLERPVSPQGVRSTAIPGGPERYARAWSSETGKGAKADPAEAIYWYGLAAADGESKAFVNLATLLVRGRGIAAGPDPADAQLLWWIAAARGEAVAMYNLGVLYQSGIGVAKDLDRARAWYKQAAAHNHPRALEALKRLGG